MDAIYIGIDPGQGGGIAAVCGYVTQAVKMPETERDLLTVLENLKLLSDGQAVAMLEKVHSSPQMGVSSSFKFGVGYGRLRMALVAAGVSFDEVTPQRWQKALGCRSGGDKNITKARAQALFPGLPTITHATADALLLAEYCRRIKTGQLAPDVQAVKPARKTRFKIPQAGLF